MSATTSDGAGRPPGRLALASLLASLLAIVALPAAARAPAEGDPAPALEARLFDGRTVDLAALHGQVVVLNLWASWCTPCRQEMPLLDALAREYGPRGVTVLGLSADDRHDRRDAERIAGGFHYALGLLADSPRNGFGSPAVLPLSYVLDARGRIVRILRAADGTIERELRSAIEAALAPEAPRGET
jgi:thiol-disulfide isomerase/thioredoxin